MNRRLVVHRLNLRGCARLAREGSRLDFALQNVAAANWILARVPPADEETLAFLGNICRLRRGYRLFVWLTALSN
jgi:hypothetical protein